MRRQIEIKAHVGAAALDEKSRRPAVWRRTDRLAASAESQSRRQRPSELSHISDAALRLASSIQFETLRMSVEALRRNLRHLPR